MRFVTILLLLLPATAAAQDKSVRKIPIGKDTTIVLGPVTRDGYVDYGRIVNERLGKGIRPEDNAMALLVQAFGPRPSGDPVPDEFFKLLGVSAPRVGADCFVEFSKWYFSKKIEEQDFNYSPVEQLESAVRRPWKAKDDRQMSGWLNSQQKHLAIVVEASKRSSFFYPRAVRPDKNGKIPPSCAAAGIDYIQPIRAAHEALLTRAMLKTAQGQIDSAWSDLVACKRLARLVGSSGPMIEMLVGFGTDDRASEAILTFVSEAKLSDQQLRSCLADLKSIRSHVTPSEHFERCGRFEMLDMVQTLHYLAMTEPPDSSDSIGWVIGLIFALPDTENAKQRARESIDWGLILRDQVQMADRLSRILAIKDRASRLAGLRTLAKEAKAAFESSEPVVSFFNGYLWWLPYDWVRQLRSKGFALWMNRKIHGYEGLHESYDRCLQRERNLFTAIALARFKLAQNRYPAKVEELVPRYLDAVPIDIFTSKPLIYKRTADGYLLYSVGVNGKDDGGKTYGDAPGADDIRVRMPISKLK